MGSKTPWPNCSDVVSDTRAGRALGIDFGRKRIGLAVSDPTGTLASPHTTLVRRLNRRPPFRDLASIAAEFEVRTLVMGLPLELDGRENEWCTEVRAAGAAIARRLELPIVWVDERLTSVEAEEAIREAGVKRSDRQDRARVDAAAAAVILQSWLDGATEL